MGKRLRSSRLWMNAQLKEGAMKKPRTRVFHARDQFTRRAGHPWPVWPVDYEYVADVETDDPDVAMKATQNVEGSWRFNENVRAYSLIVRSTSTGDILILPDGYVLFVSAVGFEVIGIPDWSD